MRNTPGTVVPNPYSILRTPAMTNRYPLVSQISTNVSSNYQPILPPTHTTVANQEATRTRGTPYGQNMSYRQISPAIYRMNRRINDGVSPITNETVNPFIQNLNSQ